MRAPANEATKIKRLGQKLTIYMVAVDRKTVSRFNNLGQEFNRHYNRYLKVPAIHREDNPAIAKLALMRCLHQKLKLPLPEYANPDELYLGNLPIHSFTYSGPEENGRDIFIQDIGRFKIVKSDLGDEYSVIPKLEKLTRSHNRRNPYLPASDGFKIDAITASSIHLASTKSLLFPEMHADSEFVLYVEY